MLINVFVDFKETCDLHIVAEVNMLMLDRTECIPNPYYMLQLLD